MPDSYNINDLVRVGQVKKLGTNINARLAALEGVGAQANVFEGLQVNGTNVALVNKIANLLITEGATNGTLAVMGTDIAVHGLAAMAYKANVSADDLADALKTQIDNATNDISALKGSGEGSVSKAVSDALNEFATNVTNDDVVNTYKELVDWAASHGAEAAELAGAITALQNKVVLGTHEVEGEQKEYATVKEYFEAVSASFISKSSLSAETTGSGNAVTDVSYDPATGKTTATKGKTFTEAKVPATANNVALLGADGQLEDSGAGICTDTAFDAMLTEIGLGSTT